MLRVPLTTLSSTFPQAATTHRRKRIDKNNAALLIIGHQVGLTGTAHDCNVQDTYNSVTLHAGFGKACNLPVVIATSVEQGFSGPLLAEIADTYPDATIVRRGSEINAWGNADFRAAVKATGKEQVIVDGIAADVCTALVSLSLLGAGYTVFASTDASGTRAADLANARMRDAGVHVLPRLDITADLQRNRRNAPRIRAFLNLLLKLFPTINNVVRRHGALIPSEGKLV